MITVNFGVCNADYNRLDKRELLCCDAYMGGNDYDNG